MQKHNIMHMRIIQVPKQIFDTGKTGCFPLKRKNYLVARQFSLAQVLLNHVVKRSEFFSPFGTLY